jgi:Alr-MurF fusion protein
MNYSIKEICNIVGGEHSGPDQVIEQISIDSRGLSQSGKVIFVAIRGERHDGHFYIPDLISRGVSSFLVEELPADGLLDDSLSFVLVKDSIKALQKLAAWHRINNHSEIIGITGSNGKTIVKEWIYQVLSPDKKLTRSPKSYNSQVGVPLSVLLLDAKTEIGVFEAGISKPGEMGLLQKIIKPSIGVFTNIGEAHQEGFSGKEEKVRQKLLLFKESDVLIYCRDHSEIDELVTKQGRDKKLFTWSAEGVADLVLRKQKGTGKETILDLEYGGESFSINVPFRDRASIENAMHVISLLLYLNYEPLLIESRISQLNPVAMRMEMMNGTGNCTLINDSYNSDLVSLSIALDYLNQQNQHDSRTLILSDIYQSGQDDESLYAEVAGMLRGQNIHRFIGIGPSICAYKRMFPENSHFFRSTSEFLEELNSFEFSNEAILIKGSRSFTFEKIAYRLQHKNHETILKIDLDAIVHNLNVYRSLLPRETKVMVMVKAFSYGSGAHEIANALQYQRIDYLSVAYPDEGVALRASGIHLPILVMNPEITSFDIMLEHNLEPELYSFKSLFSFLKILERNNLFAYPVHLKLETGMNRLGFREEEVDQLIEVLKKNESIRIASIFSHLGSADEGKHDDYTKLQISTFNRMSDQIVGNFDYRILRHILNTSGIERFPQASYDMVRLGIGLYGISNYLETKLQTVSTLRSTLSQIKPVHKGDSVGYNRNVMITRDMLVGIVPIGYADGLRRDLGHREVSFQIRNKEAPVLGNLCMDMCMVDLTGIEAEEGDEVIIFGDEKPVSGFAAHLNTIPYEVLAGLSQRIKRVYYHQ